MRIKQLVLAVVGLAALGALATGLAGAAAPKAKKPVTLLHIDARVGCAQAKTCKILPPWMRTLRNPMDAIVFADGTVYYRARVITVGRAGAGPRRCDKTLFAKPFSGSCEVSDFGVGFLKKTTIPGPYKGLDVWVASESAIIGSSTTLMVNPFAPYPLDTANPVQPGHYTIGQLIDTPTPGETLTIDVTRTPVK